MLLSEYVPSICLPRPGGPLSLAISRLPAAAGTISIIPPRVDSDSLPLLRMIEMPHFLTCQFRESVSVPVHKVKDGQLHSVPVK